MSEEPSTGAPRDGAAEGEPPHPGPDATASQTGAPASAQPSRLARALPSWVRRRPVIAASGAGILVVAAAILVVAWPSAQPRTYASLPARCEVLTAATLAKYMPEATSSLQSPSVTTVSQVDDCLWTSAAGRQSRSLTVLVVVYKSPAWLTDAQRQYQTLLSAQAGTMGKEPRLARDP